MDDSSSQKTGSTGIAFVVLMLVSLAIAPGPSLDSSTAKIAEYYAEHDAAILWSTLVSGLATVALLWFLAGLCVSLVEAGAGRRLPVIAFGAGLLWIATWWVCCTAMNALAYSDATRGSAPVVRALWDTQNLAMGLAGFPLFGLMAAVAAMTLRGLALPRWYGWLSLATALLALVSTLQITITDTSSGALMPLSMIGILAFFVWVLVGGVIVLRNGLTSRSAAAAVA